MAVGRRSTHVRTRGGGNPRARHGNVSGTPSVNTRSGGQPSGVTKASVKGEPRVKTRGKQSTDETFDKQG